MADLAKIVDDLSALTVLELLNCRSCWKKSGASLPPLRSLLLLLAVALLPLLKKLRQSSPLFWPPLATRKSK